MNNLNYTPIVVLITAILRHFLTLASGILLAYGVTKEQASDAVEATIEIAIAIGITLATLMWSYLSKQRAYETPKMYQLEATLMEARVADPVVVKTEEQ